MTTLGDVEYLHAALTGRSRPEDVASVIGRVLHDRLTDAQRILLGQAARHSERWYGMSSMSDEWEQPIPATSACEHVAWCFHTGMPDPSDVPAIRAWVAGLAPLVAYEGGRAIPSRARMGDVWPDVGRRRKVRAWRALGRLTARTDRLERMQLRHDFAVRGRSGFAEDIPVDAIAGDVDAGAFVAYFAARVNVRRAFTLSGKTNPMDTVAGMLYDRLGDGNDWSMVALLHPTPEVLGRLTDEARGHLLGRWSAEMRRAALLLDTLNRETPVTDRERMVVRRGMDSDTWNLAAQAYNRARDSWLTLLEAAGMTDEVLDVWCPPKAMRLMAADLAYWHSRTGGDVDANTAIAARLPFVGDVYAGGAACARKDVIVACEAVGADPYRTGWAGRRAPKERSEFRPTPELVHGVAVGDPLLARTLRHAGVWSGQKIRDLDALAAIGNPDWYRVDPNDPDAETPPGGGVR